MRTQLGQAGRKEMEDMLRRGCSLNEIIDNFLHKPSELEPSEEETEFAKRIKQLMGDKIRLSPFDPDKTPHLILDGANSVGLGYMLVQFVDEEDHSKGVQIISC